MNALVLSAGGTFGAYEAGAWRALEDRGFRPTIVVGTSIGAINAAAVARGCPAGRLEQWWRDPRSSVFRQGFLDQRALQARLEELFLEFPRPLPGVRLLVTLTELPSTRIRVVSDEQVTPRALLASCAIPFLCAPVKLDGRRYVDGGVFCRLPLSVAVEAGATEIVTVDLLAAPPSKLARGLLQVAIAVRGLLLREPDRMAASPGVRLIRVEPTEPLGTLRDIVRWDLANVNRWIESGYRDAMTASAAAASSPSAERAAPK